MTLTKRANEYRRNFRSPSDTANVYTRARMCVYVHVRTWSRARRIGEVFGLPNEQALKFLVPPENRPVREITPTRFSLSLFLFTGNFLMFRAELCSSSRAEGPR